MNEPDAKAGLCINIGILVLIVAYNEVFRANGNRYSYGH